MRDTRYYYNVEDGWPIEDIIAQWAEDGRKVYDDSQPVWYQPEELWKYRDYERTPPPRLTASLRHDGWRKDDPAILIVSRQGHAYLGEGNHRLVVAMEHSIPVPVRFEFWHQAKKPLEMRLADPPQIDLDVIAVVSAEELERYKKTGRVPAGTKLIHNAYTSRDRLVLDREDPPPRMRAPARKPTAKEQRQVDELLELLDSLKGTKRNPWRGRTLFHGTIKDREKSIMKIGLVPDPEAWGQAVEHFSSRGGGAVFAASKKGLTNAVGAMRHHIAQKLNKHYHGVSPTEVERHGMLVVIKEADVGDYLYDEGKWRQEPRTDEERPFYDPENVPPSVERGDYFFTDDRGVAVDFVLKGKKMMQFLARRGGLDDLKKWKDFRYKRKPNPDIFAVRDSIIEVLTAYRGKVIDARLAIDAAHDLADVLGLTSNEDLEDLANGMLVREGEVLDSALIRERANNIAAYALLDEED